MTNPSGRDTRTGRLPENYRLGILTPQDLKTNENDQITHRTQIRMAATGTHAQESLGVVGCQELSSTLYPSRNTEAEWLCLHHVS